MIGKKCELLGYLLILDLFMGTAAWNHQNDKYWHVFKQINASLATYEHCKISNTSGCSLCHYQVIARDLAPWASGIEKKDVDRAKQSGVHYQIVGGRLYRQEECMFPFRCSGVEHFLLGLASKMPDMDLVINVKDYPQSLRRHSKLPVFSFSKISKDYNDIMYPAWSFWEGGPAISIYPTGIGRWDLQSANLLTEAERFPWSEKEDKAFFRGSRTFPDRDPLVKLSRRNPDLVDAQYTKNQAWRSEQDTLGAPPATEVTFEHHCRYRYLFNFRGVAASFRLKHLFPCKSLVFHVGPTESNEDWIEFFYPMLKPWIHYIPVTQKQLTNVEFLLSFARDNQDVAQKIAQRGYEAIRNHLRMKDIRCYWQKLLTTYANLIKYHVVKDPSLKEVILKVTRKSIPASQKTEL
ncbi:protein O-glucosyltransferase 1-like isoform X1 [Varroa destructor]|uniref:Glycosyl transferase CAP10 domain-containing protein n=2 Tax=Varroa destructor TaxID=109461 RepID=A0A7M7J8V0_VARDE|nr:protein O-glucosyltransferase 1-like isoform X1 [Varroa destructor]